MRHKHDCDTCVFLGVEGVFDLYYHSPYPGETGWTVIARFGAGRDYKSGLHFANGIDAELTKALVIAKSLGLHRDFELG